MVNLVFLIFAVAAVSEIESAEDALSFLRQQPQFQALRQAVQLNPSVLPQLLQQLGQANPELLQVKIKDEISTSLLP